MSVAILLKSLNILNWICINRNHFQNMALSVKIDFNIWSQFDYHAYNIITDDFVNGHLFRVNANVLTEKGRVRLQKTMGHPEKNFESEGQTNIWFPFYENKSLYFQLRDKGFRLHFDNGLINRDHLQHNLYASFESNRKLTDHLFKLGCETIAQKWRFNLRYRYSTLDSGNTLYARWRYDYGNWTFEGIKALDLDNLILLKNKLLFGYYFGSKTFHLRLQNNGWRKKQINFSRATLEDIFDCATFNFTKTLNANSRLGIQVPINTDGTLQPLSFVWETYEPIYHSTLKLKANSDSTAALSIRNQMGIYGSYILGIGVRDIGTKNNVNFGVQVDLNV